MARYIFDIETDGLLDTCSVVWIISMLDIDTHEQRSWLPFRGEDGWKEAMLNATLLIGHNVRGFDFPALEKIESFKLPRKVGVQDTLIMSQVMNYRRFGYEGHSMDRWGQFLGVHKQEHEDWSQYSEEMRTRCESDVRLNLLIYEHVLEEFLFLKAKNPNIVPYMRAEHFVAEWCSMAELHGWPFDVPYAKELHAAMFEELEAARAAISPILGLRTVPKDAESMEEGSSKWSETGKFLGQAEVKSPKWTKQGRYAAHTADWFGVDVWSGFEGEERMIEGDYCRVTFEPISLDSIADVKVFLFRHNWEPTEWNYKQKLNEATGRYEMKATSPKITEDSLESMEGNGKMYMDFLTTKSRYGILDTWLRVVDSNDNLHGECFTIGTPSMRATHKIIVNVPSADSTWGPEMRKLFKCKPGWKLIGCDSAGNQARGLAHYLGNAEFTDLLLNGDIHTYNANILSNVLMSMGYDWSAILIKEGLKAEEGKTIEEACAKKKRGIAKRILYAFLFGASGGKLWSYVFGTQDKTQGNKLKAGFLKAVPGFEVLLKTLERIFFKTKKTGFGYIPSIAGNKVYVDSLHKLLVYLLQSCEKATCGAAVMLTMIRLEEANIPYIPCIMMHDEEDFMVPEEFAEQAAAIGKQAFVDGPKLFGITIMDGEAKIGDNWYEVH